MQKHVNCGAFGSVDKITCQIIIIILRYDSIIFLSSRICSSSIAFFPFLLGYIISDFKIITSTTMKHSIHI